MNSSPLAGVARAALRRLCRPAGLLCAVAGLAGAVTITQAFPVKFKIAAQPAPAGLMAFAKQSGVEVVFSYDDLKNVPANEVIGELEPETALSQLLRDTGFEARRNNGGKYVVAAAAVRPGSVTGTLLAPKNREALEGVTVTVLETGERAAVSARGEFIFSSLPPGTYTLGASGAGFSRLRITDVVVRAGIDTILGAQEMPVLRLGNEVQTMKEVVVSAKKDVETLAAVEVSADKVKPFTDRNVDLPRSVNDAQPYYIFNSKQIENSDAPTLSEFMKQNLTMNSDQKSAVPGANAFGNYPAIDLHGLGNSSQAPILILLDGHRLASSASSVTSQLEPSINGIPMAAIDRIEVLPSSASAIYGGGAVGGVINIVLKGNYQGGEARVTYNRAPAEGQASDRNFDLSYGLALEGGKTHVTLAAHYSEARPSWLGDLAYIRQRELYMLSLRPYTNLISFTSTLFTTPNITSSSGNLILKNGTNLGATMTYVPAGTAPNSSGLAAALVTNAGQYNTQYSRAERGGMYFNGSQQGNLTKSLMSTFSRQMTPWMEFFGTWSTNTSVEYTPGVFHMANSVTVPATAPSNPFQGAVTVTMPLPAKTAAKPWYADVLTQNATVGVKLKLPAEWRAEADYTWSAGHGYFDEALTDTTALAAGVASGAVNPFADTLVYGVNPDPYTRYIYEWFPPSSVNDAGLRFSGPVWSLPAGRPQLTVGLEHRKEGVGNNHLFSINPSTPTANSDQTFFGLSESTDSIYIETLVPLVGSKNALPLVHSLELQLAGRTEAYEVGTGTTSSTTNTGLIPPTTTYAPVNVPPYHGTTKYSSSNPTIALKWEPFEGVILRTSYAKAFLPPTFGNLTPNAIPAAALTTITDPQNNKTYGVQTISGGNPALTPQHSVNWNAGVIYQPTTGPLAGFRFNAEYWNIDQTNVIGSLSAQVLVNNGSLYPSRITRDPATGLITLVNISSLNLFESLAQGWDGKIDWRKSTEWGTYDVSSMVTYTVHLGRQNAFGSPLLEYANYSRANTGIGTNKLKANLTVQWSKGPWTLGWATHYWSSFKQAGAPGDPIYNGNPAATPNLNYILPQGSDHVSGQMYHDLSASYAFAREGTTGGSRHFAASLLRGVTLQAGIIDLFNTPPPFDANFQGGTGGWTSGYGDPRLRRYWASVKKAF